VFTERRHGSRLTEEGKELLRSYRQLKRDCQKADDEIFHEIFMDTEEASR
jgi:molybdenum-dependent DNA-binding transcriptional regulator ModE